MKKYCILISVLLLGISAVFAQGSDTYFLDGDLHGQTINVESTARLKCDGVDSAHSVGRGYDYWVTFVGNCSGENAFTITIDDFDLRMNALGTPCADTLFIYDGSSIYDEVIWFATGNVTTPSVMQVPARPTNAMQALTIRFKVCNDCGPWNHDTGHGFSMIAECKKPCEPFTPVLDSIFYKTRNGVVYSIGKIKHLYDYSEFVVWDSVLNDSVTVVDSTPFNGVNLCIGDGVIFTAHCEYNYSTGWYYPTDSTSFFYWNMGNGDTIAGVGVNSIYYDDYFRVSCNELILSVVDSAGCGSAIYPQVRVRLAQNPLKTVFTLRDICNRDSLLVSMGYGGTDATLLLDSIRYEEGQSQSNTVKTFIPDGPNCEVFCYSAPVTFTEFPNGLSVASGEDICSICINYEHSFMGDYRISLVCPNGRKAVLKYGSKCTGGSTTSCDPLVTDATPQGAYGGSGTYTGIPYGGGSDGTYDNHGSGTGRYCDSVGNMYGVGFDYCFSRNSNYTLATGNNAATTAPVPDDYIASTNSEYQIRIENYEFITIPEPFVQAGITASNSSFNTKRPSDHENKTDYYLPADNFSKLIGCPLNGEWSVEICDFWGADNGWVFSWSLDICNVNTDGCQYQVAIDSLVWGPDTSSQYHDYELGHYRGAEVHRHTPIESYVLTPDTAGTFPINVKIYDEFGCIWDTSTSITSYWTPKPNLGNDTTLCGVVTMPLDASDYHAEEQGYKYIWEPFGQETSSIITKYEPGSDISYIAQVTNTQMNTVCVTRDTIDVKLRSQPFPSFVPIPFALEGCSPYTLTFDNQTANADKHLWLFGDGQYSEQASPTHTYTEGVYDLKYYVTSIDGCKDSLIFDDLIAIYPSPKAAFVWEPNYPSVLQPTVLLTNTTENANPGTHFFWEMQYDRNNLLSVQTLTDNSTSFVHNFADYVDPIDLAGSYTVRLIARNDNMAPSGNIIYCRDTTENTILLVNDFLQFPSVVTPNGDGINDKFIIGNLEGGMAYPVNTFDVFNKWGTRVFHKENIATEADMWDPADVPAGTYFYRFSARGYNGNIEHNGAVEVVK